MKDYYFFLGVKKTASQQDIRQAYRRLSAKYHPDKNQQDPFFVERFQHLQIAYELLSDIQKRKVYDSKLENIQSKVVSDARPIVLFFKSNKIRARAGKEITLSWSIQNADLVKIDRIGKVSSQGEMIYKLPDLIQEKEINFVLWARNSWNGESVAALVRIELIRKEKVESNNLFVESIENLGEEEISENYPSSFWGILILIFILLIIFYTQTIKYL